MAKQKLDGFGKIFKVLSDDPDIRVGFADIDLWADTGVYALNRRLSNDYHKGFLYGRSVGIYGEPGSGKSLLLAQTAANEQRNHDAFIVWVDVEAAVSDRKQGLEWFRQSGINTEHRFERLFVPTFRKALKTMTQFVSMYREDEGKNELPPLMIIFDSYSALQTDTMIEQNRGKKDLTQDMGQKPRQLGDFVSRANSMVEGLRILVTGVMHVYVSQEEYGPRHKISGGIKAAYVASQSIILSKSELNNEKASPWLRQGNEPKDNIGIKSIVTILKCRYAKPFEKLDLEVVYPYGIHKYSGLFDLFIDDGTIWSPSNGWYEFKRLDGTSKKFQRKDFPKYVDELIALPIQKQEITTEEVEIVYEDDDVPVEAA